MEKSRIVALETINDIEDRGMYSNIALGKRLTRSGLSGKDRGFVTELVYGVVENRYFLENAISQFSKIRLSKLSPVVLNILKMGVYQILILDGVKDFAAVNESVELAKKFKPQTAGFVNAVLRNLIRSKGSIKMPSEKKNPAKYLSVKYSYEEWIADEWIKTYGVEFTKELMMSNMERPSIYIRTNTLKTTREQLLQMLSEQGIECEAVGMAAEAIRVRGMKNIESNELFAKGMFFVQDISSMLVAHVANPKNNMHVLDVCSAPGGKTTHMATLMENTGCVEARDVHEHKIGLINQNANRLGLKNINAKIGDATKHQDELDEKFDIVLADVPCSGFGIISRKPEIKYKSKQEIDQLPSIQMGILENVNRYVKKDGLLIYSTCTIEYKENMGVVSQFLKQNSDYVLEPIKEVYIDMETQKDGYIQTYPNIHGIDGFFIAKLRKVR
ncbi:16S rRNA (cytosine967-C5)-methyltransferase [Peptoclostridium litorale DSM 5388]|uniref:16S rRNA (cytosine(967)-C(5))-methyltransferase n=1 Tax=Peptoclostridium litorale DSM 5388 TaxID=1121324 RepID=A0A069RIG3_PEPLI|nr:16S rRNA (cytosine(967)-C(5))-methyltransferase RsmB [Peptoclostridium litorale]KDR94032.1 ribosomal RNA small subunit methyltransferase B [Peptoclostridium litorale DSM 5388]SIN79899.1 16S rRNA (cytosine967-C5)-methyltransferase [Peptoclostridium litorale DSM 5388]